LLARDGKPGRAEALIAQAWKAAPHPALALAYRDLRTDETPPRRAERLGGLAEANPGHRESLILRVEQALTTGDGPRARDAALPLAGEDPVSARLAGLFARVAYASGEPDEARVWLARGLTAPHEPAWSDLGPDGRAFAYDAADWTRLAWAYAETGQLVHPRHERNDRTLSELPQLPLSYAEAAPFLAADGHEAVLYPVEDEGFGDDDPTAVERPPPPRRSRRPRRLASGRGAAK
ncbi:MAG TPA: heme biosynthesis protein HemY, partial [Phenylobacterium sp.]|nr:heme biosynthesis protein HemY [Phenylobacterium sp.]